MQILIQVSLGFNLHCILLYLFTEDEYTSVEGESLLSLETFFSSEPVGSHDLLAY